MVVGRLADAVLAADVGFFEDRDDLGLGEFALLDGSVSVVPTESPHFVLHRAREVYPWVWPAWAGMVGERVGVGCPR